MPEVTGHAAMTPSWVDLGSPDLAASARFYGQLFGWEAREAAGPEMGNYTMLTLRGKVVAGMGTLMAENQPPAWTVYFATDDIDNTVEKVRGAGGMVMMGPDDIMDSGRLSIFSDPTGAVVGLWQAGAHKGAAIVREPNSFTWTELQTRDIAAAKGFYQQVFGWGEESNPMGPGQPDYTEWKLGGLSIGGAMPMQANIPPQVPPHWLVYFRVDNADRAAEQITQLGGRVMAGPMDFPGGRFAVVSDPQGAAFGILEMPS